MKRIVAASSVVCLSLCAQAQDRWNELGSVASARPSGSRARWADSVGLADTSAVTGEPRNATTGEVHRAATPDGKPSDVGVEIGWRQPQNDPAAAPGFRDSKFWFVRAGVGPEYTAPSRFSLDTSMPDSRVTFYPGQRIDGAIGYQFLSWFALEANLGLIHNSLRSVEGSSDADGDLLQMAHMINAVFTIPLQCKVEPYVGVGAGLMVDYLHVHSSGVQGTHIDGDDTATAFGWQFMAGARIKLNDRWKLGIAYEYLESTGPQWEGSEFVLGHPGSLLLRRPRSHTLSASFVYAF